MTLGMAPSVQAVESNKLLARLAAQQNFQQGLPEWLRQLKLSKYTEALSKWCHKHHVTSPEDLSALALAAAIAVEPDLRLRQIVEPSSRFLASWSHWCFIAAHFWCFEMFFISQPKHENMLFLFFLHFFNIFYTSLFCFIFRLRLFLSSFVLRDVHSPSASCGLNETSASSLWHNSSQFPSLTLSRMVSASCEVLDVTFQEQSMQSFSDRTENGKSGPLVGSLHGYLEHGW